MEENNKRFRPNDKFEKLMRTNEAALTVGIERVLIDATWDGGEFVGQFVMSSRYGIFDNE